MQDIVGRVAEFLIKYNLQDKTVIVGFSGGFDSMCLLDILSNYYVSCSVTYSFVILTVERNLSKRNSRPI